MKSSQRIRAAVEGKLPMEELTDRELRKLERMVFRAIARRSGASTTPSSQLKH